MASARAELINPFIASTVQSLQMMLATEARRVDLYVKGPKDTLMRGDLSVMMSMFKALEGTVVLSFPESLAAGLVGRMLGDPSLSVVTPDVLDGLGEIGNLVCGSAKSAIAQSFGQPASVSLPTVIRGTPHHLQHLRGVPCIGCVFECDGGRFWLEVAVKTGEKS